MDEFASYRGDGTSLITVTLAPGGADRLAQFGRKLNEEVGAAAHIKSRANRLSVQTALASAQYKLKSYKTLPLNGLVILCGLIEDGKKINVDFEPLFPLRRSMYKCDNRFHVEDLKKQLEQNEKDAVGFIIVDGNGCLIAAIKGTERSILSKFEVNLPKKHGRGGQSANRFARLGQEARHEYLKKVADSAFTAFKDRQIDSLVIAGSAELKHKLSKNYLDKALSDKIIAVVDVAYGFNAGLEEAVGRVSDKIADCEFVKEKKLLSDFFDRLLRDDDFVSFGSDDVIKALEMGAVETLICWRESEQLEYCVENHKKFGAELKLVSDQTSEGAQFVNGFGGVAAILRFPVHFDHDEEEINIDDY